MNTTRCRHCCKNKACRPQGLCWNCFYTPAVRALYPSTSKFARRGVSTDCGGYRLPEPTEALPGTAEKESVLASRAEAGLALFHPRDAAR